MGGQEEGRELLRNIRILLQIGGGGGGGWGGGRNVPPAATPTPTHTPTLTPICASAHSQPNERK